jgi:hypothetical protein
MSVEHVLHKINCDGIFIMSVEHVIHKINSFRNFYCIINFLRNKFYRGTSVPSQIYNAKVHLLCQFHAGKVGFQLSVKLYTV